MSWPELRERLTALFKTKTRDEWCEVLEMTDACFAPVLTMAEAAEHPHMRARGAFVELGGVVQPAPAPRFSRTHAEVERPPAHAGQHSAEVLSAWGFADAEIRALRESKAIA